MTQLTPLILERKLDSRLWGGHSLGDWLGIDSPPDHLAESWQVYEHNRVAEGPHAGRTLAELAREHGAALVGTRNFARGGADFPLLAKFIDAADHLSIQVRDLTASAAFYEAVGSDFEFSVDVKDPAAVPDLLAAAQASGPAAVGRLWLCHDDHDLLRSWRDLDPTVRLVDSTRLRRMKQGPERHAARLQSAGIDAVNLHHSDWTGGLTTLFHRFEVLAFGWDAQFDRILAGLLDMGIDGLYSDHVDRMVDALDRIGPDRSR